MSERTCLIVAGKGWLNEEDAERERSSTFLYAKEQWKETYMRKRMIKKRRQLTSMDAILLFNE